MIEIPENRVTTRGIDRIADGRGGQARQGLRARIPKALLLALLIGGASSSFVATTDLAGATSRGLKVVTQFQPPASGQIEVIATTFSARFNGKTPPPDPITNVTLPGASKPLNYGILYGSQLIRASGNVASYVWLTMALKPLGAAASHDQPLVGESLTVTPISTGSGSLHTTSEELTINNADESERVQFAAVLRADGVLQFSVIDPHDIVPNRFHWELNPIPSSAVSSWNSVFSLVENPQLNVATVVPSIDAILHANFLSGSGPSTTPTGGTLTGRMFAGSLPGTVDLALTPPSGGINALRLTALSHAEIKSKDAPPGWTCLNTGPSVVQCKGPTLTESFTTSLELFHIRNFAHILAYGYPRGTPGEFFQWNGSTSILPEPPTATPGATSGPLSVNCPSSVTQGQSIQITIHVGTAAAPVKVSWALPDGSSVLHTAIPNTTNPTTESDSIGTNLDGPWHAVASSGGQSAACRVITVYAG